MKKIIEVSVLFCIVCVAISLCVNSCKQKIPPLASVVVSKDSTTFYKDLYNTEHAQSLQIQSNLKELAESNSKLYQDFKKRNDIKDKQIQSLNETILWQSTRFTAPLTDTVIAGQVKVGVKVLDSIKETTFSYQDSTITELGLLTKDSVKIWYTNKIVVDFDCYWKRPYSFLGIKYGKPVHYIDGYSKSQNTNVIGLESIYIKPKTPSRLKWFLIGLGTALLLSIHK